MRAHAYSNCLDSPLLASERAMSLRGLQVAPYRELLLVRRARTLRIIVRLTTATMRCQALLALCGNSGRNHALGVDGAAVHLVVDVDDRRAVEMPGEAVAGGAAADQLVL